METLPLFYFGPYEKAATVVKPHPKIFQLNASSVSFCPTLIQLSYRMIIAIATQDSVFLYDTQQLQPFALIKDMHYASITDLSWYNKYIYMAHIKPRIILFCIIGIVIGLWMD